MLYLYPIEGGGRVARLENNVCLWFWHPLYTLFLILICCLLYDHMIRVCLCQLKTFRYVYVSSYDSISSFQHYCICTL